MKKKLIEINIYENTDLVIEVNKAENTELADKLMREINNIINKEA